ncbi:MAG TPA: FAD-dependent oxidoreductase [Clostridia bacterium]|nr:FAD-dependent oxidoreductase [Clostridia bacterium]
MEYDLIVIGGGPAGYLAAERAGRAGLSVLLAEKKALGGVCLNEGCIPTKTMLYSAKLYDNAVHSEKYGITVENAVLNHEVVLNRKNKVVRTLTAGIRAKLRNSNVTVVEGSAVITGKSGEACFTEEDGNKEGRNGDACHNASASAAGVTGYFDVSVGDNTFKGRHILIATGSIPVIPPIHGVVEGIADGTVLTSGAILTLKEVPGELVIIGGGVIGLEMASYYNSAGSRVTVIEMLDHVGGPTDREIAGILMKNFSKKGIDFRLNARVTGIRYEEAADMQSGPADITDGMPETGAAAIKAEGSLTSGGLDTFVRKAAVVFESNGQSFEVKADKVLLSIGRRPATEALGLDKTGVVMERGRVVTDIYGRTNVPGAYAAGDVNGISMLAHTAYREAEVCVNNILGREDCMCYGAIPSAIYTNPEVAGVGETEETAAEKGMDFETLRLPMTYSGRYVAENEGGDGICKVIVDKNNKKIIGVHMIGNYSSEIIYGAAMMIEKGMTAEDTSKLVFPHPTVSEIIREVLAE